ncbi:hypothetical protein AOQ84DRAFT_386996 [Glonium stellatum]|uniref:RING-type domain-containing protein n=1 Tax=Glonium stellatum TaxID=574774 RepID=A0A8E2JW05_9PEZI|nr:hypothetical protein AOQ84DRAFT_386996 [Glonium stellatum]
MDPPTYSAPEGEAYHFQTLTTALEDFIGEPEKAGQILGRILAIVLITSQRSVETGGHAPPANIVTQYQRMWAYLCQDISDSPEVSTALIRTNVDDIVLRSWARAWLYHSERPDLSALEIQFRIAKPIVVAACEVLQATEEEFAIILRSVSLNSEQRNAVDVAVISEPHARKPEDDDCSICVSSLGVDAVRLKACGHLFCLHCID